MRLSDNPSWIFGNALRARSRNYMRKKKDELQSVIQFVSGYDFKVATNFKNFRD